MKSSIVDQTILASKDAAQQQLETIKSFQWISNTDENSSSNSNNNKVYAHFDDKTLVTTYKTTQNFIPKHYSNIILDHYRVLLSTIELRNKWCPWLKNIQLIEKFDSNITSLQGKIIDNDNLEYETTWLEQTSFNKQSVQFIAASSALDFFMAIEIENLFDAITTTTARATIYLQWIKPTLATPSFTLTGLIQLESYPWISQCDALITIQKLEYDNDGECRIDYIYQQQDISQLPQAAVDIHQKINHHNRWHSGSWDQQPQQQQTIRKNKFLTSSSLLFTSSANSSPQLHPTAANSSYPDKQHSNTMPWLIGGDDDEDQHTTTYKLDKDELRIQVAGIPQITITLPERLEWSDKFAQLCVRCYHRNQTSRQQNDSYVIQILHPQKMMQYFIEEEESMRLDDDEDIDPILVNVVISKSNNQKFIVNENEWPIRSWTFTSDDDGDGDEYQEKEEEDDIFVDGMEELIQETNVTNDMQTISSLPSSSTLIQTIPAFQKADLKKQKEETVNNNALPIMHPLTKKTSVATVNKQQNPPLDANKILIPEPYLEKKKKKEEEEEDIDYDEYRSFENKLPVSDPAALQKSSPLFNEYLQQLSSSTTTVVQSPSKENGHVIIKKIDIANHPLGGFLSESTWKDCSIWDIKAVLESAGARKIWDNTFENSTYLHALTPTSSLWHTKMKGTWPVSPRDYVCFHGQYASPYRIDLLSTSCFGDSFQYKPLPQPITGYTRATIDVMRWRLERMDDKTASVKQVLVTQFPTWVIQYITSRFIVQTCAAVQSAREYFESFGAPPSLENLTCAQLVNVKHDHERKNWRCEYTRRLSTSEKDAQESNNQNTAITATSGSSSTNSNVSATSSSQSTISVVRLDKRRWAANNNYAVVIDPPPSRVSALQKICDPYGVWLTVEHDEAFIIPLRGKILVLIKSDELATAAAIKSEQQHECTLNVNGNEIIIEKEERKPSIPVPDRIKQPSFSQNFLKEEEQDIISKILPPDIKPPSPTSSSATTATVEKKNTSAIVMTEEAKIEEALNQLPVTPKEHAQAAMSFLKLTDEQFGWTVLSDNNKSGIRISKKPGIKNNSNNSSNQQKAEGSSNVDKSEKSSSLQVFDPYMVYKGSKVIENFSVDEIRSVVTDVGHIRALYDDTIEPKTDLVRQDVESGCRVIRQSIKALFPFKNREIYAASCLAQEELTSLSNTKRTLYIESSLPDFPLIINPKKTRGHLFMSGWILEPIDPYNTTTANHPIPSTRVIYVAALDLGASVPSYISNLVANNWFPKKIQAVETYLKSKGPPPVIVQPFPLLVFSNNTLSKAVQDNVEWTCVNSSYDEKHHFKVTNRLKILTEQKKSRLEDVQPTASSSASLLPPFRRPSNHTLTPETRRGSLPTNTLPKKRTVAASPSTAVQQPAPTASSTTSASTTTTTATTTTANTAATAATAATANAITYRSLTCLQATFDLRPYTKGYEVHAQFYQITDENRKNISSKLELSISEPPLSNFVEGNKKNMKHTVTIKVQGLSAANVYELEFTLIPVREETLSVRATQLTVSHVLGEDQLDDGSWRGIILVNGIEVNVNSDIKLKALQDEEKPESSNSDISSSNNISNSFDGGSLDAPVVNETDVGTDTALEGTRGMDVARREQLQDNQSYFEKMAVPEEREATTTGAQQYIGGGVVATALGNVSAGVNNFGARMMNPFRAASNSFSLSKNSVKSGAALEEATEDLSSEDDEEHRSRKRFTREERSQIDSSTMTMHEIRLLRKSSDTMRKGMLLLVICLGLAVVFALLMLQPLLERYYSSFTVSSTVASLNSSIEEGVVRRLMQIPWFGGWNIQLIAVRRRA